MALVDLTELSSDEDHNANVTPLKGTGVSTSTVVNGSTQAATTGEKATRERADFPLESATRAVSSNRPASPRRKSVSPSKLPRQAADSKDATPTRGDQHRAPKLFAVKSNGERIPKMARKAAVDSRLTAGSSSSGRSQHMSSTPQPRPDRPDLPQSLTIRETHAPPESTKPTSHEGVELSLKSLEDATRESLHEMRTDNRAHTQVSLRPSSPAIVWN